VTTTGPESGPTDAELVARAGAGDREAFVAIYQRHHAGLYRFARAMTGSTAIAEDVTQEVFLALIGDLARYDPSRAGLATYLYAIARNVSRYKLRRERRFVGLDLVMAKLPKTNDDPSGAMIQSQAAAKVRVLIKGLPSRYREVLILCDLQELSYEQAAVVLNTPVGTVRSRLHRARRQLADRLTKDQTFTAPVRQAVRKCLI
jgi:RNA polymerase sigma-70 factor (ECF subfamily)